MKNNRLIRAIVGLGILVLMVYSIVDFTRFPLAYDSVGRYHLMNDLNDGNPVAIKVYYDQYVAHGRYLFNGEVTFRLVCRRHDVDNDACSYLYSQFSLSDLTVKQFESKFMKPR